MRRKIKIAVAVLISIATMVTLSFQACSQNISTFASSSDFLTPVPIDHPPTIEKMAPSQKIVVAGKTYVAELMRDIFSTDTKPQPIGSFGPGFQLTSDQSVTLNGYQFVMQSDGNAVLYDSSAKALWYSYGQGAYGNCTNCRFTFQGDGNLVIYNVASGAAIWDSKTGGLTGTTLKIYATYPFVGLEDSNTGQVLYPKNFSGFPDLKGLIEKWILNRPAQYGGSCNPYDTYATADCGGNKTNTNLPSYTVHNTLRESFRLQFCQNVLGYDEAVTSALAKIGASPTVPPTAITVSQMYGLFYRDEDPTKEAIASLMDLDLRLKNSAEPSLERWRTLILQVCESPGWQLF